MTIEERPKKTTRDSLKDRTAYSPDALLKMVNLLYDPLEVATLEEIGILDIANLMSLTRMNSSREIHYWAMTIVKENAKRPLVPNSDDPTSRKWSLRKIYNTCFWLGRRSLDMRAFMMGVGLAGKQSVQEEEEEEEGFNF